MVPVGQRQDSFFVVLILVGRFGIVDDQRASKPIRILAGIMGMIPISPWLLDLRIVNLRLRVN